MKKFLALLLSAIMVCSMFTMASASSLAGTYDITVWVAEKAVDLTKAQIDEYNNTNELGIKFNATIEAVSEADAATQMVTDVEAGGDLFCFAQDQFARLVQAGALAKLGVKAAETVSAANTAGVVAAATAGDTMYAYPLTADNGYFMYYDKTVVPEEHIDSLEAIIADCEAAQKYFSYDILSNAWYLAGAFFGTGCVSEWTMDEEGKEFVSVKDTFNSPEGLIAAKGIEKIVKSSTHLSSSAGSEFASGAAVVVTGTWDYETIKEILGDNMGVADLPSFEVDGQSYHLGSFNGCKLMGVKPQTDPVKAAALHQLAQYLTGEKCQLERFEALSWGPANLNAQNSDAVLANPGLVALNAQAPYSVPQGQIHGSWWDIAKVIGEDIRNAKDEAGLQAALDNYYNKIAALFTMTADEKNAWGVIGSINGDTWTIDLPMTNADGVWTTDEAYTMDAGTEFKVRQGKSWDNAFPASNFVVDAAGTYKVQFVEATGEVTLIAQ